MLNPTSFIIAALIATASCAPVTPNPQAEVTSSLEARAKINNCNNSSFTGATSGGSPYVEDCKVIARNIAGGGTWTTTLRIQRKLVSHKSCAFGVTGNGSPGKAGSYKVGNQDIIDLINDSIRKFQSGGRVGASGKMACQTGQVDDYSDVVWGLYHN